jgi:hypothetical protein
MIDVQRRLRRRPTGARKAPGVAALLVAMTPLFVGCYGAFPLTRAVYRANGSIENELVRQGVFWAFVILPVYETATIADAVVFNLIDFWTSTEVEFSSRTDAHGNTVAVVPSEDGKTARLTVSPAEGEGVDLQLVRVSERRCEVRSDDGELLGAAIRDPDGRVALTDADGSVMERLHASAPQNSD